MKKKKKWLKWAILAVVVLAIAAWFLLVSQTSGEIAYTQTSVTTGDITTYYNFDGLVYAPHVQTITAGAGDTVKAVYVQQNQQVEKGDKLLKLENGGVIKADLAGEVTSLPYGEDDLVSAGAVLCEIIDMDRLEVRLDVDEYDVNAVTPGTQAQVTVLAAGSTYSGMVTALNKNGTASGDLSYYTATVALEETDGVYPGMQVSAKVLRGQALNAAIVKLDAVQFDEYNQPYVIVRSANGKDTQNVAITVGVSDGIYAEVTSGVKAGDTVLKPSGMNLAELMQQVREQRGM